MSLLRYKADHKTVLYMGITTALLFVQWNLAEFNPYLFAWAMFMGVTCAVMAHNINHVNLWKNQSLNNLTDYWLTFFYGFPAFAWIPTHNLNHHQLTNKEGDYTITYRYSNKNNLLTLLSYPTISGIFQQKPTRDYLKKQWGLNKKRFFYSAGQYVFWLGTLGIALALDWQKALLYIVAPQQFAVFAVLIFNYVQHVHADEESELNHSRNFIGQGLGSLNWFLFNNGLHTAHHENMGLHWSKLPAAHAEILDKIDPRLNEKSFWWYIIRVYILGIFVPKFRTFDMRSDRMAQQTTTSKLQEVQAS